MSVASPKFPSATTPSTNRFRRFKVLWMNFNNHIDRCAYKNNAAVNELEFVGNLEKETIASELYTKKSLTRTSKLQRNWNYIIQNENYSIFVYHLCVRLHVYCFQVNYSISTRDVRLKTLAKKEQRNGTIYLGNWEMSFGSWSKYILYGFFFLLQSMSVLKQETK